MSRDGVQHVRALAVGGLLQLSAGGTCFVEITHRKHDLDVCGQESRACEALLSRGDYAATRCSSGIRVALKQAQEGEPGLRLETRSAGFPICRLRQLDLTPQ